MKPLVDQRTDVDTGRGPALAVVGRGLGDAGDAVTDSHHDCVVVAIDATDRDRHVVRLRVAGDLVVHVDCDRQVTVGVRRRVKTRRSDRGTSPDEGLVLHEINYAGDDDRGRATGLGDRLPGGKQVCAWALYRVDGALDITGLCDSDRSRNVDIRRRSAGRSAVK